MIEENIIMIIIKNSKPLNEGVLKSYTCDTAQQPMFQTRAHAIVTHACMQQN